MKAAAYSLLVGLALFLITQAVARKAAELRFQISSPIALDPSSPDGTRKLVQQIEVANVGNAVSDRIQITIHKPVASVTVEKDSQADKHETIPTRDGVELRYDSLRPEGRIRVVFTAADAVKEQDLQIRDQERLATPALQSGDTLLSRVGTAFWLLVACGYSFASIKSFQNARFSTRAQFGSTSELLQNKPFLISDSTWKEGLKSAVRRITRRDQDDGQEPKSWRAYKLLDSQRPAKIADDLWITLVKELTDGFLDRIEHYASGTSGFLDSSMARIVLETPKPSNVSDYQWRQCMVRVERFYCLAISLSPIAHGFTMSDALKAFNQLPEKPLDEQHVDATANRLRRLYYTAILESLQFSSTPTEDLGTMDVGRLDQRQIQSLRKFAYFHQMSDFPNLTNAHSAERFLKDPRPKFLTDADYDRFEAFARAVTEIASAQAAIKQKELDLLLRESTLVDKQTQVDQLAGQVTRQLRIIHESLTDPTALDRIEQYDNAFAPGNLANLRKLVEEIKLRKRP